MPNACFAPVPARLRRIGAVGIVALAAAANARGAAPPASSAVPVVPTARATPPAATDAPKKPAGPAPAPAPAPAAAAAKPPKPAAAKPVPVTAAYTPGSGVVMLERAGRPLGVGTILAGDGRVLSSLSILGDARPVDVRYADGHRATARIGHADRGRDLALLVPQSAWHKQGLKASQRSPAQGTPLRAFTGGPKGAALGARVTVKGPADVRGVDGKPVKEALELATPLDPASAGTPLVDDSGEVLAVVARACRPQTGARCVPVTVALPVSAVRDFLRSTPATATLPVPFIGVRGVSEDTGSVRGVRITNIAPGSPAAGAGLRAGGDVTSADVLVAIDGIPVITPDALRDIINERAVGEVLDLLVFGRGRFRHVTVVVAAVK